MESTGGENGSQKRRCTSPTRSVPSAQPDETKPLPPEVWDKVLCKLSSNEDDLESLLTCRIVCKSWKELVDKMPPKLVWNPWIEPQTRRHAPASSKSLATEFTNDEDVSNFLAKLPTSDSDSGNPFTHNQTVRLLCYENSLRKKTGELINILDKYGRHIKQVVYEPMFTVPESLTLPRVLSTMENIETLIIDVTFLLHEERKCIRGDELPRQLNNLRELVIELDSYTDKKVKNESESVYAKLAASYGPQIRFLTMTNVSLEMAKHVLDIYPNLEALKLENLSDLLTSSPSGSFPKLRRLVIGSEQCKEGLIGFKNVLGLIRCFSETLELLSLGVKHAQLSQSSLNDDDNEVESGTVFKQLKELILPFVFVSLGRNKDRSLESRFGFQFPELKRVILQDSKGEFKNKDLNAARVKKICRRIWDLVPPSVETIGLRTENWSKHLGRHFPVVHKCSRSLFE